VRLFLAIDVGEAMRREIGAVQARLREKLGGWRWIDPRGIHLTVRFLGEVGQEALDRQLPVWRDAAGSCSPVRLRVGGSSVFPPRGAPRVLWIGVEGIEPRGAVDALGRVFERAARDLGLPPENRPFRPHLTLARADRHGRPVPPPVGLVGDLGEIEAREIVLFRSELGPGGARYTPLQSFALGEKGA